MNKVYTYSIIHTFTSCIGFTEIQKNDIQAAAK